MRTPVKSTEEAGRFFKRTRDGLWLCKSSNGGYIAISKKRVFKLQVGASECSRRWE
jgi:hypothetical protein